MAWNFGESFDLYANPADMAGYWDAATNVGSCSLPAGRFAGSRALQLYGTNSLYKTSGVNDQVHHIVVAYNPTTGLTVGGTTLWGCFTLYDGTTAQCSIVFRNDGAILLVAGASNGTVIATFTGAYTNAWTACEFEVVIAAAGGGSFAVRINGASSNSFTASGLTTQQSANAYGNKVGITSANSYSNSNFDDFFWQSGAIAGAWLGDTRCYTRMPAFDVSDQWTMVAAGTTAAINSGINAANSFGASNAMYKSFVAPSSGLVSSGTIQMNVSGGGGAGHMKAALFSADPTTGLPASLIATSTEILNPGAAVIPITFPTPVRLARGSTYWIGVDQDASMSYNVVNAAGCISLSSPAYAAWPVNNPGGTISTLNCFGSTVLIVPEYNSDAVSDTQQDGLTSYVSDNNIGDADFYGLAPLALTPVKVIAVVTRGYMEKSDAGPRNAVVQLQSGSTVVASATAVLSNTGWQWVYRMDLVDPNTGAAWTGPAVNAAQIGPKVVP